MRETAVGIIGGTGEEGRGIALRLGAAGVPVVIGSRSASRALEAVAGLRRLVETPIFEGVDNLELPSCCGILVLAVPFSHAVETIEALNPLLSGEHVLVDVTVPLVFDKGPRLLDLGPLSGAEYLRDRLTGSVPFVAAFKTLPAHLLADLERPLDCDDFICGDSEQAKERVLGILQGIPGIRWIDAGPLRYARSLEAMTVLAIGLNRRTKSRAGRFRFIGA